MSETLTDLSCGAGGSGQGAAHVPGLDRRVGPGEPAPALPAPTTSTSEMPRAAATAGRAVDTHGSTVMSPENAHPDHTGGGFVPRLGTDPSSARYELLTAAQAVERVAAVGFDRADAEWMVDQYLAVSTAAVGPPSGDGWRVDPYDLAEIARGYEWVDHYRGETIADAQARAAEYAADYQRQADAVDREQDPGYAARIDCEAVEWADRAHEGYNPWLVPNSGPTSAEGSGDTEEDRRRQLNQWHQDQADDTDHVDDVDHAEQIGQER